MTRPPTLGSGQVSYTPGISIVHFGSPSGTAYVRPCSECGSRDHASCTKADR
jgi:hypothetical protein